ncbi:hypothetical protein D3C72_1075460 [compost metagenome]
MKQVLLAIPLLLTGCSTPLPFIGYSLDGKAVVQIEAKVVRNSGEWLPVANTSFSYKVIDPKYNRITADLAEEKQFGSFTTDFDGKATIVAPDGLLLVSGFYSINSGNSKVVWDKAEFYLTHNNHTVRISNENGTVTNN